jgi:hypothetical protein
VLPVRFFQVEEEIAVPVGFIADMELRSVI